jgi:hypothetical protein
VATYPKNLFSQSQCLGKGGLAMLLNSLFPKIWSFQASLLAISRLPYPPGCLATALDADRTYLYLLEKALVPPEWCGNENASSSAWSNPEEDVANGTFRAAACASGNDFSRFPALCISSFR